MLQQHFSLNRHKRNATIEVIIVISLKDNSSYFLNLGLIY